MSSDDLDRKLKALREASERISANLVELEIDSGRQLMELSALEGQSAATWSPANAALTELWRRQSLLEGLLERAEKLRGWRRAGELRSLLEGPSIELACSEVPIAERNLLGGSQATRRCSPDELIASMSAAFDQARAAVSAIGGAWQTLIPRLETARQLLEETRGLADALGEAGERDLRSVSETLERLGARVSSDPLSVREGELDEVLREIRAYRDDLRAAATLSERFGARMTEAEELLERARATLLDAESGRAELLAKITAPDTPPALPSSDELQRGLSEITRLAEHGAWRQARRALEDWRARADAVLAQSRTALRASRAPIEERNQLRALLEAYQVKAKHVGVIEHSEVEEIFARAHEVLFTAPTDLALATRLVQSYQRAVSRREPAPETLP